MAATEAVPCNDCGRGAKPWAAASDGLCYRCRQRRKRALETASAAACVRGRARGDTLLSDDPAHRERIARYAERAALGLPLFEAARKGVAGG